MEDGRIILLNVGIERLRVVRWLDDDPYPQAEVESYPDAPVRKGLRAAVDTAAAARRRLAALLVEMGAEAEDLEVRLPEDPSEAAWELCVLAPLGPFDHQKLLEAKDPIARMRLLELLLEQHRADLERLMHGGGGI